MELKLAGGAAGGPGAPQEYNLRVQMGDIQPMHSFTQHLDGSISAPPPPWTTEGHIGRNVSGCHST